MVPTIDVIYLASKPRKICHFLFLINIFLEAIFFFFSFDDDDRCDNVHFLFLILARPKPSPSTTTVKSRLNSGQNGLSRTRPGVTSTTSVPVSAGKIKSSKNQTTNLLVCADVFGSDSETVPFSSCPSSPSVNRRSRSSSAIPRPQPSTGSIGGIRSLFCRIVVVSYSIINQSKLLLLLLCRLHLHHSFFFIFFPPLSLSSPLFLFHRLSIL